MQFDEGFVCRSFYIVQVLVADKKNGQKKIFFFFQEASEIWHLSIGAAQVPTDIVDNNITRRCGS